MAFIEWEFESSGRGKSLSENEISVFSLKNSGITINKTLSEELVENGFLYLIIMQDDITGELGLNFTKDRGLKLQLRYDTKKKTLSNLTLMNKRVVARLLKVLKKEKGKYTVIITENLSKVEKNRFYRIIRIVD